MQKARYFIGIDLHKTVVQVCVLDRAGEVVEELRLRLEEPGSAEVVVTRLEQWRHTGRFVVEALGLNRWFVNACQAAGLAITVADATKLGLRALGKKTDRRDAYELARRLWLGDIDRHATTYYPSDAEYGGRKLVRIRHELVGIRQQVTNQIRSLLNAYRVPAPKTALYSGPSLQFLRQLDLVTPELTAGLQALVHTLQALQAQIAGLTRRIRQDAQAAPMRQLQEQLPSVGPQTAMTLHYELGDLRRFQNAKQVAAYVGLAPRVANSADTQHHGRLTKRGNAHLRWLLTEWAVRLLAFHPEVQAWAVARRRRMHQNKVRVALARRLLVGVYVSQCRAELFSLTRCLAS